MDLLQTVVLALIQGLTEFLPVSSSAHLILPSKLVPGWADQGLAFDVSVHAGTLLAVIIYFRRTLGRMIAEGLGFLFVTRRATPAVRLLFYVLAATVPAGLCGLAFKNFIAANLRSEAVIAVTTFVFGVVLWLAEVYNKRAVKRGEARAAGGDPGARPGGSAEEEVTFGRAMLIGCAQALALVPGTSRSGITITAGYFLKMSSRAAAEFSFLMSVPVIALSALLMLKDIASGAGGAADPASMLIGAAISFVSAYLVIRLFLGFIERIGLLPYVIYRLLLGAFLFYLTVF